MSAKCKVHIPKPEEMMVGHYSAELAVTLIDVSLQSSHLQQRLWSTDLNFKDVKHLKRSNTQRNLPDTYINDVSAFTLQHKTSHIR